MTKKAMEYDYTKEENDAFLPLRDTVFNQLRLQILHGELKPGERLMEVALAERLGVSRTPVREAIRMLEQEGLAVLLPRRGAHVASITEKQLEEMLEVRRTLETFTVNAACSRITYDELKELRSLNDDFAEAVKAGDVIRIAETDTTFHEAIARYAGNTKIESILYRLKEQIFRYNYEYLKDTDDYDHLVTEHTMICDAFEHGSNDRAVEVIKLHIDTQELGIYYHLKNEDKVEEKYNRR
ncbi:DNA-binding transcriptional regulator, GntR family [Lachnospiraceae bacterium KH1T2]|jgi:DNA-binding GntR family transcriptional regulator|nr:DNA-binding transcriptional regulator, GntR family [Lachnospiraceae bacterium KH1T2]